MQAADDDEMPFDEPAYAVGHYLPDVSQPREGPEEDMSVVHEIDRDDNDDEWSVAASIVSWISLSLIGGQKPKPKPQHSNNNNNAKSLLNVDDSSLEESTSNSDTEFGTLSQQNNQHPKNPIKDDHSDNPSVPKVPFVTPSHENHQQLKNLIDDDNSDQSVPSDKEVQEPPSPLAYGTIGQALAVSRMSSHQDPPGQMPSAFMVWRQPLDSDSTSSDEDSTDVPPPPPPPPPPPAQRHKFSFLQAYKSGDSNTNTNTVACGTPPKTGTVMEFGTPDTTLSLFDNARDETQPSDDAERETGQKFWKRQSGKCCNVACRTSPTVVMCWCIFILLGIIIPVIFTVAPRTTDNSLLVSSAGDQENMENVTVPPSVQPVETIFYAIGDVPYRDSEKVELEEHVLALPDDAEFLIHVGDIRSGEDEQKNCTIEEYIEVRDILLQSPVPVFIIPGDNEWNDCPNPVEGMAFWLEVFHEFDKNWDHSFQVQRNPLQPENFNFVHKKTLYIGLNLVGGSIFDKEAFSIQLDEEFDWAKALIEENVVTHSDASSIVIFGHAFPTSTHDSFFEPLQRYIEEDLDNDVPIMYLNGDYHFFEFEKDYLGQSNFHRLQVQSGTKDPPLQVSVSISVNGDSDASDVFSHDRMLQYE